MLVVSAGSEAARSSSPVDGGRRGDRRDVLGQFGRLVGLEVELGLAELREFGVSFGVTAAIGIVSASVLSASLVALLAGLLARLSGANWEHLVVAGGSFTLLALAGAAWSAVRIKSLRWPEQTLRSLKETSGWLGAQLRSKRTSN